MKNTVIILSLLLGLLSGFILHNEHSATLPTKSSQGVSTKLTGTVPLQTLVPLAKESTSILLPLPPQPTVTIPEQPVITSGQTAEQEAKEFIYFNESSNNPAAVNSIGCRGLGQACPGSKLTCSDHDYECQDVWFTRYMENRYGTWVAAKAFWQSKCSSPEGCWW